MWARHDFRARLGALEPMAGTVVTLAGVELAELTAGAVDFVWIDLEHGALGRADVGPLAVAARAGGAACLVRLGGVADPRIGSVLDAGVDGVVAPRVQNANEARGVVEQMRYPPSGSRGVAARRAAGYGEQHGSEPDLTCMAQIESASAVEEAEAIAAVDGVDALVIGCADLAMGLGDGSGPDSATFRDAVAHVQRAAAAAGVASGIAGPDDPELLAELANGRSTVLVQAADVRIYARALHAAVDQLRRELAPGAPNREESHVRT